MALVCPICKSPAQELPRTGDATGFDCPTHGKFKVADTIAAEECTRQRWEAALRKAKLRAKPREVPLVMSEISSGRLAIAPTAWRYSPRSVAPHPC